MDTSGKTVDQDQQELLKESKKLKQEIAEVDIRLNHIRFSVRKDKGLSGMMDSFRQHGERTSPLYAAREILTKRLETLQANLESKQGRGSKDKAREAANWCYAEKKANKKKADREIAREAVEKFFPELRDNAKTRKIDSLRKTFTNKIKGRKKTK